MARKVTQIIELTDDLDGGKADQTVSFAFNGSNYEIDLSKKNATALNKALKPYLDSARKVRGARSRTAAAPSGRGKSRSDLSDIRAWAKSAGYDVSDRGRIPASVTDAYDSAH
jgi:hypothetical protein